MSRITTHVLDTSRGRPAGGLAVRLEREENGAWREVGGGATSEDGRLGSLVPAGVALAAGAYRLVFESEAYFRAQHVACFHPVVIVVFRVTSPEEHHHVPLLLSPFGYTTYRGS